MFVLMVLLVSSAHAGAKEDREAKKRAAAEDVLTKADGGDVKCMVPGGLILLEGRLLDRDQARGLALLERAAGTGDGLAMAALYEVYEKGKYGLPKDPERADYWAEKGGIVSPRIQARNERMARDELQRQAAEGSLAASTMLALDKTSGPDIAALEQNALAGDQAACGVLFDLHMRDQYQPGPEIENAWSRYGLLTKDKVNALAAEAKGK
jgi:TPR repeat protein